MKVMNMKETTHKCPDCKGVLHESIFFRSYDVTELHCPICKKWFKYWWRSREIKPS